jgi:hypothetical protein
MSFAGMPAPTVFAVTSLFTTAPAATTVFFSTVTKGRLVAPARLKKGLHNMLRRLVNPAGWGRYFFVEGGGLFEFLNERSEILNGEMDKTSF